MTLLDQGGRTKLMQTFPRAQWKYRAYFERQFVRCFGRTVDFGVKLCVNNMFHEY